MSNFSDEEDMTLVSLVMPYVEEGRRVCWSNVATKMRSTNKTRSVLCERLKTLKKTYGAKLDRFPRLVTRSIKSSEFSTISNVHEAAVGMLGLAETKVPLIETEDVLLVGNSVNANVQT